MPKRLPNGVLIFNATSHPLQVWNDRWSQPVVVEVDETINARAQSTEERKERGYVLVTVEYLPTEEGNAILRRIQESWPDAVVVGSAIAASAYKGLVVAPTFYKSDRTRQRTERYIKANRFTIYKEPTNNA